MGNKRCAERKERKETRGKNVVRRGRGNLGRTLNAKQRDCFTRQSTVVVGRNWA